MRSPLELYQGAPCASVPLHAEHGAKPLALILDVLGSGVATSRQGGRVAEEERAGVGVREG